MFFLDIISTIFEEEKKKENKLIIIANNFYRNSHAFILYVFIQKEGKTREKIYHHKIDNYQVDGVTSKCKNFGLLRITSKYSVSVEGT